MFACFRRQEKHSEEAYRVASSSKAVTSAKPAKSQATIEADAAGEKAIASIRACTDAQRRINQADARIKQADARIKQVDARIKQVDGDLVKLKKMDKQSALVEDMILKRKAAAAAKK
jgi:hypothetical protein